MQEVIARGGMVFLFTDDEKNLVSENIRFKFNIPKASDY